MSAWFLALQFCLLCTAGCEQLKSLTNADDSGPPVPAALFPLHQALEDGASASHQATVAVLAVVDQSRISSADAPPAAGEAAAPADSGADAGEALRLERLTRQELNNGFIRNRKLDVAQPDEAVIAQARDEVIKGNSAALSSEIAKQLGEKLHVQYIVSAVIEDAGTAVNVACQRADDGTLVFQDSVKNWSIFAAPESEPAPGG